MRLVVQNFLMLALCVVPALSFAQGASGGRAPPPPPARRASAARPVATTGSRLPPAPRTTAAAASATSLRASAAAADAAAAAAAAARTLFANIIGPSAMLAGGLVPLGFLAGPIPDHTPALQKLRRVYYVLSIASLSNELLAITYATVASNKLTEVAAAPAASVFALIKRDYELQWVGCNVHFLGGLLGFVGMVLIRAYALFPAALNRSAAGIGGAALLAMVSVVNAGVAQGDGRGGAFGGNVVSLGMRYLWLLVRNVWQTKGVVALAALLLGVVSLASAGYNLFLPETYRPAKK